nr:organomercurial lyase [Dehalococcoidales bacterium]
ISFVLTKEEKLLGRSLQFAGRPLTVAEITELGQIDDRAVEAGLGTLVDLNLTVPRGSRYRLVTDWASRLGPLGWTFHTVTLHGEGSFNVPCAVDFLLLTAGAYRDRELVIEDSCAHCTDPIRVVIHRGLRVEADPPETMILGGSG